MSHYLYPEGGVLKKVSRYLRPKGGVLKKVSHYLCPKGGALTFAPRVYTNFGGFSFLFLFSELIFFDIILVIIKRRNFMSYLEHYSYKNLLRVSFPVVIMLLFTSVYTMVDGLFVSNFVGKNGFTAVNLIMPYLLFFGGVGFIFGRGGSALIGKTLGEKNSFRANQIFTTLILTAFITGIFITIIGITFLPTAARLLGAKGEIYDNIIIYGTIYLIGSPFCIIQRL